MWCWWENDTRHSDGHLNYDEVILVCYNAVAKVGYYLKQLHGKPNNIWIVMFKILDSISQCDLVNVH